MNLLLHKSLIAIDIAGVGPYNCWFLTLVGSIHMVRSMTGYGAALFQAGELTGSVEIRTVNHRYLDLHIKMPREYGFLETEIHHLVRKQVARGRVDVSVSVQGPIPAEFQLDLAVARQYLDAARKLKEEFNLEGSLDLNTLLTLPGVFRGANGTVREGSAPDQTLVSILLDGLRGALEGVTCMRIQEGHALKADLRNHVENILAKTKEVRELIPTHAQEYKLRLDRRMSDLIGPNTVDATRLEQEIALLVERADASEELSRLESHLQQFSAWLESDKEAGKSMDFILQEMQREINTMLAKSGNLEITRSALAIKADIEKLREQVQNVE